MDRVGEQGFEGWMVKGLGGVTEGDADDAGFGILDPQTLGLAAGWPSGAFSAVLAVRA